MSSRFDYRLEAYLLTAS